MDYFELIEKRYSVRKFKEDQIPDEDLEKIIHAAGIAPSGKNSQNWHFVVIKNKGLINSMAKTVAERIESIADNLPEEKGGNFRKFSRFSTFFAFAPVVVAVFAEDYIAEGYQELVLSNDPQINIDRLTVADPGIQSIGAAIDQMILAAFDLGYGACWMTSANNSAIALEELIGFHKEHFKFVALVPIGVPEGERRSPAKKELSEIMTIIE